MDVTSEKTLPPRFQRGGAVSKRKGNYRVGIDVGSTTIKTVFLDENGDIVFSDYRRHHADVERNLVKAFMLAYRRLGDCCMDVVLTGSVGMGFAERFGIPFVQEVVASVALIQEKFPEIHTFIDIGGEDAKMIFFEEGRSPDIRMNGSCAGGTGAFIDQMASLLGVEVEELSRLAESAENVYPIASRCGVFSKTDVQNLISRNVSKNDIAASVFNAVAMQVIASLSRGYEVKPKIFFCGGPFAFIPALQKAFMKMLSLEANDCVFHENAQIVPAWGAATVQRTQMTQKTPINTDFIEGGKRIGLKEALEEFGRRVKKITSRHCEGDSPKQSSSHGVLDPQKRSGLLHSVRNDDDGHNDNADSRNDEIPHVAPLHSESLISTGMPKIFQNAQDFEQWKKEKDTHRVQRRPLDEIDEDTLCFLGVDSGSTTTKIVLTDREDRVLFDHYVRNEGNSLQAFVDGLKALKEKRHGKPLKISGSAVTGYGENLLKAAFNLDFGMIETIAHYMAARKISPHVSFILDIGGQDMKAAFIENGSIKRLEINEACSSGCGSFIEGFANMLNYPVAEFAQMACLSENPCDLGTRCTVFMNSKVKQAMREGAKIQDIAAGLAYSVVKNCLYKVLKLKDAKELGDHIVVQGGTFRNLSVVRALELLTNRSVSFSDMPELMGALGAALYAKEHAAETPTVLLDELIDSQKFETDLTLCTGCENNCYVKAFLFANGNTYYSGNKCEKIFSNKSEGFEKGANLYKEKHDSLFVHRKSVEKGKERFTVGIPRGLNMYENYPFWHALFTECGIRVVLSGASTNKLYEKGLNSVMSDNICFPAKLMHGHVLDLVAKKVDRIFFPYIIFEQKEDAKAINTFNCPVVTGYSDVLKSAINTEAKFNIPIDAPTVTFADKKLLFKACKKYLNDIGISGNSVIKAAFEKALEAQQNHFLTISSHAKEIIEKARNTNRMVILLAGRPYHSDPLIQHKISDSIADMGIDVITEDVVRFSEEADKTFNEIQSISQWAYPNRIFKAAAYAANSEDNLHYVQLTSFGCGPDAFIVDEVNDILKRKGKTLTLLKIDDVNNIGSLRLRIRSMVESLAFGKHERKELPIVKTPAFEQKDRHRKIIAPYFAEGYSELLPTIFKLMDIELEILPSSNPESVTEGLKYANNEICYPATLVVGDIIKALKSGKYDPNDIAVAITQTGGQCRATNYIAMIKKAMLSAGFKDIPVVSVAFGNDMINEQPGFELKWRKSIIPTFFALLYADCLTKFYYAALPREKEKGAAERLRYKFIDAAKPYIAAKKRKALYKLLEQAAEAFNDIIIPNDKIPVIGVVGEIYVKYNSFSHKNILQWLSEQGVETVAPSLYNFFLSAFVSGKIRKLHNTETGGLPIWLNDALYNVVYSFVKKFDRIASKFRYYRPFADLRHDAHLASKIINLSAQFGEGWLIPAELANFAEQGVYNAISLQPFGCIANHVISKGIEKQVKKIYPEMQMLFLDFDADSSEANVLNRLHFMVKNARERAGRKE
ncbi:MAG: acyl-CoA dehydratase activase-related protein [Bacteroidales bacterium]|nr:acyl-CoA dehydratase activase-related protein [Bacteroidales bacterium]